MKSYHEKYNEYNLLVGEAEEIKAYYKSISRASRKGITKIYPLYVDLPLFTPGRMYCIKLEYDEEDWGYDISILNSDSFTRLLVNGEITED